MFRSARWSGANVLRIALCSAFTIALIAALAFQSGRTTSLIAADGSDASAVEPNDFEPLVSAEHDEPACAVAPLTFQSLLNAEYTIPGPGDVDLSFHLYQGRAALPDNQGTVRLVASQIAFGDLDGDGCDDALVTLELDSSGGGPFLYVVPMVDRDGSPRQAGREFIGERASVEIVGIAKRVGTVVYLTHGPSDEPCCPTHHAAKAIRLRRSVPLGSETSG